MLAEPENGDAWERHIFNRKPFYKKSELLNDCSCWFLASPRWALPDPCLGEPFVHCPPTHGIKGSFPPCPCPMHQDKDATLKHPSWWDMEITKGWAHLLYFQRALLSRVQANNLRAVCFQLLQTSEKQFLGWAIPHHLALYCFWEGWAEVVEEFCWGFACFSLDVACRRVVLLTMTL